jgi:hypothetical protein
MKTILLLLITLFCSKVYLVAAQQNQSNKEIEKTDELTSEQQENLTRAQSKKLLPLPAEIMNDKISTNSKKKTTNAGEQAPADRDVDFDDLSDTEELLLKTDPDNPDTDGDGLWDGWEVKITNGVDLRALGASPLHKDIFVEMDYMLREDATNGLGPNAIVIGEIERSFADANVPNPDGLRGINIHLVTGNEIQYDPDLSPYMTEFYKLKKKHFDRNRAPFFHI